MNSINAIATDHGNKTTLDVNIASDNVFKY